MKEKRKKIRRNYLKCVGKLSIVTKVSDVQAIAKTAINPPSNPKTAELFVPTNIRQSAATEEKNKEIPV